MLPATDDSSCIGAVVGHLCATTPLVDLFGPKRYVVARTSLLSTVSCFQPSPHYVCETLGETDTVDTNIVLANKGT